MGAMSPSGYTLAITPPRGGQNCSWRLTNMRADGRANNGIRPLNLHPGYQAFAEGSALMEMGMTRVVCAASVEERVPPFLRGAGMGWVTAEYAMLPRSTLTRSQRETTVRGRSAEIQRMIGRSLRAITDRTALGERTIHIDCDVLQADGGTRTAAVNGAYVALHLACRTLIKGGGHQPAPATHCNSRRRQRRTHRRRTPPRPDLRRGPVGSSRLHRRHDQPRRHCRSPRRHRRRPVPSRPSAAGNHTGAAGSAACVQDAARGRRACWGVATGGCLVRVLIIPYLKGNTRWTNSQLQDWTTS